MMHFAIASLRPAPRQAEHSRNRPVAASVRTDTSILRRMLRSPPGRPRSNSIRPGCSGGATVELDAGTVHGISAVLPATFVSDIVGYHTTPVPSPPATARQHWIQECKIEARLTA